LPMHTARIPPVDPAPATITAVLAMHAGHICPSSFRVLPQFPNLRYSSLSSFRLVSFVVRTVLDMACWWWS
jgi:hypothetical protein